MENILRYSVTVQFDVSAGDAGTLEDKLAELASVGLVADIKAKSTGKTLKEINEVGE